MAHGQAARVNRRRPRIFGLAQGPGSGTPPTQFRECAPKQADNDYCPEMVVVAELFLMVSPSTDKGAQPEIPQH